jgi:DNA mismatch repair protein MutL
MEILKIGGYIGKISASRKSRSNQFIFVNNRFIRSPYLNHAISASYEEYLGDGQHPVYFLYLDIDPDKIDVNIHPTKQEIKFEDERLIYNYIRVAVKHVLGKFTYTPSLDFDYDDSFNALSNRKEFKKNKHIDQKSNHFDPIKPNKNKDDWEKAFEILNTDISPNDNLIIKQEIPSSLNNDFNSKLDDHVVSERNVFQIHNSYVLKEVKSGFILIDQKYAHERILYEEYLSNYNSDESISLEQLMFPKVLSIEKTKVAVLRDFSEELSKFGFIIEEDEKDKFFIKALPANINDKKGISQLIVNIIDDYVAAVEIKLSFKENFSRALAKSNSRNRGSYLTVDEMNRLIDGLFKCENPYTTPSGKKCFIIIEMNEILKRFGR